jgi:hypothetical protein
MTRNSSPASSRHTQEDRTASGPGARPDRRRPNPRCSQRRAWMSCSDRLVQCSAEQLIVTGFGTVRTEVRDVPAFSVIAQNGTEFFSIEAEDNRLPDLTSAVSGGTLRLGTRDGLSLSPPARSPTGSPSTTSPGSS